MKDRRRDLGHVRFISAGAGSGKTYRLTRELERALAEGRVKPAEVIGTTFTVKAATELQERVLKRLIEGGRAGLSEQMDQALIGTVHSVCTRLLGRFAFELGLSPEINVASAEDGVRLFNQALDDVLRRGGEATGVDRARSMSLRAQRLALVAERQGTGWQDDVREIAQQARSNDVDPASLPRMGRESAERLLGHFPEATCGPEADEALLAAVREAIADIDLEADTTKKTRDYVAKLRGAEAELRHDNCKWTRWISLSKSGPAKRSEDAAIPVQAAASRYDRHAGFHDDIREYIEGVFAIAAEALARFQELKTARGLVDYPDMEQLMLRALDEPAVAGRLREEVRLLLVDELQDTNPMQLALFMKFARFADEVVFVGDIKQAIFDFRGSDPELVGSALDAVAARGGRLDVLDRSWRSRPSLVRYFNAVFSEVFQRDGMRRDHVELSPQRREIHASPAVARWTLPRSRSLAPQADALALAIAELVDSGHHLSDRETGQARAATYGDIAVLAATNGHVQTIANALRRRRIPMKMTLAGLLETPEVALARACLRRLNDPSDTLATAEIRALGACEEPEEWLADRLRWLASGERDRDWAEADDPIVSRIARLRGQTTTQSPVEIVARVLNYVGLRPIATAWGPDAITAAQRQRNLDAFLHLSVEYEGHCASRHEAATLTGFLFWLDGQNSTELDLQPVVAGGDAVHVLTYHRAKGLEWPVVVATDFHYKRPSRIWGVRAEAAAAGLDLDDPLKGRAIRFYPEIFGGNTKGVPVLDNILASEEGAKAAAAAAAEGRRLAYVGMTRARDTLIIALPPPKPPDGAWVRDFDSAHLLPTGDSGRFRSADGQKIGPEGRKTGSDREKMTTHGIQNDSDSDGLRRSADGRQRNVGNRQRAVDGGQRATLQDSTDLERTDGQAIPTAVVNLAVADSPPPEPAPFDPTWFVARSPSERRLRERVSPSRSAPAEGASVGTMMEIGPRVAVHSNDMGKVGTALHAVIAAELVNPRRDDAVDRAAELIREGAGQGALSPRDAVACARRLMDALHKRFAPRRMRVEYPVEHVKHNGQVLRGWIDLLLETGEGWVVIDHKSSPRPRSEWKTEALECSGQLAAYADALQSAGLRCAGCWVHFPVSGGLVEVVFG